MSGPVVGAGADACGMTDASACPASWRLTRTPGGCDDGIRTGPGSCGGANVARTAALKPVVPLEVADAASDAALPTDGAEDV